MSADWQLALLLGVLVPLYGFLTTLLIIGVGYLIRREWRIWRGRRLVAARERERETR